MRKMTAEEWCPFARWRLDISDQNDEADSEGDEQAAANENHNWEFSKNHAAAFMLLRHFRVVPTNVLRWLLSVRTSSEQIAKTSLLVCETRQLCVRPACEDDKGQVSSGALA